MSSAFAQDAPPGAGSSGQDRRTIKACQVLLSNARATGDTSSLFAAAALNEFAALSDIADSGEGPYAEATEIYLEARALADEHSRKIGAKPNWEAQIERIRRRRAKSAKRREFPPDDFPLADEFIRRNLDRIFRDRRTGTVYLWGDVGREWLGGDEVKRFVVAFLKGVEAATPAEQKILWSSRKLASVLVAIGASDTLPIKEVEFDANPYLLGLPEAKV
jgi:hypothetical protein